ncbi:MAG: DUF423 domain-containing protein [Verrucomicrobiota bacterium]
MKFWNSRIGRVRLAALLLFLAVTLGAFGAHGLEDKISAERMEVWKTACLYQLIHALALFVVGRFEKPVGYLFFLVGIILFSGSLYLLVLTDTPWLGAITPFGGGALLLGWLRWILAKKSWIEPH